MIDRIITGAATDEDVAEAQALDYNGRRKLLERLLASLNDQFEETMLLEDALEDVSNALRQARPVFAAGLPIDQALGFITKMIQQSLDELGEAGAEDSEEYEKQELVLETLNKLMSNCEEAGKTQGEEAFEAIHLEYRGEVGKLDSKKSKVESSIGNSIAFLQRAYSDDSECDAFVKALDRDHMAARFIGKFGSKSLFAYKHIAAPGETYTAPANDTEGD